MVLWSILIFILFLLFIPFNFKIDAIFNYGSKKIFFSISIIFIKLIGGYANLYFDKIIINYSKNKTKILYYKSFFKQKNSDFIYKIFSLKSYKSLLELGTENDMINASYFPVIYVWSNDLLCSSINISKPHLYINNDLMLVSNDKKLNYYVNIVLKAQLYKIVIELLKILVLKVFNGFKRK